MKRRLSKALIIAVSIAALFLITWAASMIKCEILTSKYYDDFANAHQNNVWISDATYFKVLYCDRESAKVYYVSDDLGTILEFHNQNGAWKETSWHAVWAAHGTASNAVWPYWWHGNNILTP